ncbi:MAG TPA: hypothetical protein VGQ65_03105 [Thermoanaerobaculia bacterium]|nr:hypothetical protein [Thermoanaerobaculia bacterium]
MKTDVKKDNKAASSRPTPADLPPLRRVTAADVQKVEALVRARRTTGT